MQTDRNKEKEILKGLLNKLAGPDGKPFENFELTTFCAMRGENSTGDLMIIGRAVNGWQEKPWESKDLLGNNKIEEIIKELYDYPPMRWVMEWWDGKKESGKKYKTRTSAFWRVARSVAERFGIPDATNPRGTWPTHLIWSNLYKLSHYTGANPLGNLAKFQRKECIDLLKVEISQWQPKKILFLTGFDEWADKFLTEDGNGLGELNIHSKNCDDKKVQMSGKLIIPLGTPIPFVVASHPQSKKEGKMVEEIKSAFVKLENNFLSSTITR